MSPVTCCFWALQSCSNLLLKSCGYQVCTIGAILQFSAIVMCMTFQNCPRHFGHLLQDFVDYSAPALLPVFQSATGESLRLLTASSPALSKVMPRALVSSMLIPLLAKAADEGRCAAAGSQSHLQGDCVMVPQALFSTSAASRSSAMCLTSRSRSQWQLQCVSQPVPLHCQSNGLLVMATYGDGLQLKAASMYPLAV